MCCPCRAARCLLGVIVFAGAVLVVSLLFRLDRLGGVRVAWAQRYTGAGQIEDGDSPAVRVWIAALLLDLLARFVHAHPRAGPIE
eukprot:6567960-Heterocapsa_arctica.AAC.1